MSEAAREMAALPQTHQAPIPRGMHCRGPVVWVNMSKKTYHQEGDPYFGRTKNGEYMCQAAANAAGYRMAGTAHHSSSMNGGYNDNGNGGYNNGGSMSGTRHHRRSSGNYYNGNGNGGYNGNGGDTSGNGGDTSGNGNGG